MSTLYFSHFLDKSGNSKACVDRENMVGRHWSMQQSNRESDMWPANHVVCDDAKLGWFLKRQQIDERFFDLSFAAGVKLVRESLVSKAWNEYFLMLINRKQISWTLDPTSAHLSNVLM